MPERRCAHLDVVVAEQATVDLCSAVSGGHVTGGWASEGSPTGVIIVRCALCGAECRTRSSRRLPRWARAAYEAAKGGVDGA